MSLHSLLGQVCIELCTYSITLTVSCYTIKERIAAEREKLYAQAAAPAIPALVKLIEQFVSAIVHKNEYPY